MKQDSSDEFATLILAAQEDPDFRQRLLSLLHLPRLHREPLVHTAVDEMTLRGEPAEIRAAFLLLVDDEVARRALAALELA